MNKGNVSVHICAHYKLTVWTLVVPEIIVRKLKHRLQDIFFDSAALDMTQIRIVLVEHSLLLLTS